MLYTLQSGGHGGELPMGMIYLPIFTEFLPKEYAQKLERQYLEKKMKWVNAEQRGEGDVLAETRKKNAVMFVNDKNFMRLKKKGEKMSYIMFKMGSEWTTSECEDIYQLTKLLGEGVLT
jgi:hypothetical protein